MVTTNSKAYSNELIESEWNSLTGRAKLIGAVSLALFLVVSIGLSILIPLEKTRVSLVRDAIKVIVDYTVPSVLLPVMVALILASVFNDLPSRIEYINEDVERASGQLVISEFIQDICLFLVIAYSLYVGAGVGLITGTLISGVSGQVSWGGIFIHVGFLVLLDSIACLTSFRKEVPNALSEKSYIQYLEIIESERESSPYPLRNPIDAGIDISKFSGKKSRGNNVDQSQYTKNFLRRCHKFASVSLLITVVIAVIILMYSGLTEDGLSGRDRFYLGKLWVPIVIQIIILSFVVVIDIFTVRSDLPKNAGEVSWGRRNKFSIIVPRTKIGSLLVPIPRTYKVGSRGQDSQITDYFLTGIIMFYSLVPALLIIVIAFSGGWAIFVISVLSLLAVMLLYVLLVISINSWTSFESLPLEFWRDDDKSRSRSLPWFWKVAFIGKDKFLIFERPFDAWRDSVHVAKERGSSPLGVRN